MLGVSDGAARHGPLRARDSLMLFPYSLENCWEEPGHMLRLRMLLHHDSNEYDRQNGVPLQTI